ncbi:MAG: GntR family transcriptional regulator [Spirochaetia bacterium]|jgi:DNA-binding GntR family transcriptional regulator|nr:GntR family transcriptional regulator [Spirochaetia bacterium]
MVATRFEDLAEQVYRTLRDMILAGELVPGQKLVQEALSERLGVSRTPLLAAFSKLEKEMLVELVPRRGAFVKRLSPAELLQLYEVRLRLEPLGAFEAARHLDRKGKQVLDELHASYHAAVKAGEPQEIRMADYHFHMAIMNLSGNAVLERILSSFAIVSKSNQRGLMKPAGKSLEEHEALRAAITSKNAELSETLMREHLTEARDNAARILAMEGQNRPGS